jgi:CheY-like chemotaxis protein
MNYECVLIVDDDIINHKLIGKILEKEPYKLLYASSGKEAIDICLTKRIDIILMDLKMPEMNGFEASSRIKEIKPWLPIILQTAYAKELKNDTVILSLVDELLEKPIKQKELISKLKWQLKINSKVAC